MLKYFRPDYLRWFLSRRRLPYWVEYQLHRNPEARAQKVLFTRERFHYTRKVGSALYLGCIFAASWKIQPYLIKFGDDKEKEQKDQKREDPDSSPKGNTVETLRPQKIGDEDTELSSTNFPLFNGDSIFIPLGSSRPLPVAPYKGDDPEWQEFLRLNQDKGRVEDVKFELATQVLDHISAQKQFQRALGQPIECSRYWLDIIFPGKPPPEYERPGLEISWNGIRWATRPVLPYNHFRLKQALWPKSLWESFYASYNAAFNDFMKGLKSGKQSNGDQSGHNGSSRTEVKRPSGPSTQADSKVVPNDNQSSPTSSDPSTGATADTANKSTSPSRPAIAGNTTNISTSSSQLASNNSRKTKITVSPPLAESNDHPSSMTIAFLRTLVRTWKPASFPPSRGTVLTSGLVEVYGPRAVAVLYIQAAYNPKESYFERVNIRVDNARPRVQRPRG